MMEYITLNMLEDGLDVFKIIHIRNQQDNRSHGEFLNKSLSGSRYNRDHNLKRHMNDMPSNRSNFICSESYCSPVSAAAARGHEDAVEFLLKLGADPNFLKMLSKNLTSELARDNGYFAVADVVERQISDQGIQDIKFVS